MAGELAADGRLDPTDTCTYTWLTYKLRFRQCKAGLQEISRQSWKTPQLARKGPRVS